MKNVKAISKASFAAAQADCDERIWLAQTTI